MTAVIWALVAAGCNAQGWVFWRSMCWPYELGRLLVALCAKHRLH